MSLLSINPVETSIPKEPTGVEGLTSVKGENQSELALSVENNTASAAEPGTPDCPEVGTRAKKCNEAKDDGDVAIRASSVEGFLMNGSVASNGEDAPTEQDPLPSLKTLEDADALFQKGCNALKGDDFAELIDSLSCAHEIRLYLFSTCC